MSEDKKEVTEALDLVVEACSQWRNLDEPLGTIIEALNKFMTEDGPLDYRRERPTGFIGPKEIVEYGLSLTEQRKEFEALPGNDNDR